MASYTYSLLLPLLFFVLFQGPRRVGRPLFPLGRPAPGVFFPALGFCLGICSFSNYLSSYVALLIREALHQPVPTYRAAIPESGLPMVLGILSAAGPSSRPPGPLATASPSSSPPWPLPSAIPPSPS